MDSITTNLNRVLELLGGQPLDLVQLELNHLCKELEKEISNEMADR